MIKNIFHFILQQQYLHIDQKLFSKEPDTINWLNNLGKRNKVLYDIGGNKEFTRFTSLKSSTLYLIYLSHPLEI